MVNLENLEKRIKALEEFEERIKLGQRWLLCASITLGSLIATGYYLLSSWSILTKH